MTAVAKSAILQQSFNVSFLEEEREYVVINNATGKTVFLPDLVKVWNTPGEDRPPMMFAQLDRDTLAYADGDFHCRKEIGLYNPKEGWVCIVTDNPGFLNLEHYDVDWQRDLKDNIVSYTAGYFEFYDLATGIFMRFTAKLVEEPETGRWHLSLPEGPIRAYEYNERDIQRRIEKWTRDHAEYNTDSDKFAHTSVSIPTGTGFTKLFRHVPNKDGILFEFWEKARGGWSDKFERYFDAEYRNIDKKTFFYTRVEVDTPVYGGQNVEIYRTMGGLQIEDTLKREKYFYIEDLNYLIRTSWDADILPIEALHNQMQIFDCAHPGYMPRMESNCSGGPDDRGMTRQIIGGLAASIAHHDYEAIASIIRNRLVLFQPEPEEEDAYRNPRDNIWDNFPPADTNWYHRQRNREVKLLREGRNTPAADVLQGLLGLKSKDQYDNTYYVIS